VFHYKLSKVIVYSIFANREKVDYKFYAESYDTKLSPLNSIKDAAELVEAVLLPELRVLPLAVPP